MSEPRPSVALRALCVEDAETIAAWGDDPEFCRMADWSESPTRRERAAHLRGLIERPPTDLLRLGVEHQGVLVGYVDLHGSDPRERELGYLIGERSRWGRGLGLAAASAACVYGFKTLQLTRIRAEVAAGNVRSIAILMRLGMRELGSIGARPSRRFVLTRQA